MIIQHPTKIIAVHTWDWHEQPDWESIAEKVNDFQLRSQSGIGIKYIETQSDEHCIVLFSLDISDKIIESAYSQMYDWDEGKVPEELDWESAYAHLNEIRLQYTQIGMGGMPTLQTVINPLFVRYSNGERTVDLFNSVMDLC
jgi:hypothetical protein